LLSVALNLHPGLHPGCDSKPEAQPPDEGTAIEPLAGRLALCPMYNAAGLTLDLRTMQARDG
jgi:hypothetical protein